LINDYVLDQRKYIHSIGAFVPVSTLVSASFGGVKVGRMHPWMMLFEQVHNGPCQLLRHPGLALTGGC
jgi:hypothetical protein